MVTSIRNLGTFADALDCLCLSQVCDMWKKNTLELFG